MSAFPIETARLLIRQPTESDYDLLKGWMADPEIAQHVGGPRTGEQLQKTFEHIKSTWSTLGFGHGALVLKSTRETIGLCGISPMEIEGKAEYDLGCLIAKNHWNQGFATEASQAMVICAKERLGIQRLTAWPSSEHKISIHILEKIGFKFEKTINKLHYGNPLQNMSLYIWTAN